MRWQKIAITFLFFLMALGGIGGVVLIGFSIMSGK